MLSGSQGCSDEHTCQAVPDYWLRATMPITGFTFNEGGLSQEATSNQASGSFAQAVFECDPTIFFATVYWNWICVEL